MTLREQSISEPLTRQMALQKVPPTETFALTSTIYEGSDLRD